MNKARVFLVGSDTAGWALDEDHRLARQALESFVELTDLEHGEIVHAIHWEALAAIPLQKLFGKKVVCQVENSPFDCLIKRPAFMAAFRIVGIWMVQSHEAENQMGRLGIRHFFCPYRVDMKIFRPLVMKDGGREALRQRLGLPGKKYLIGNFHRDTEGRDLKSPKVQKGPDIFIAIVRALVKNGLPVHVVLAGPRRGWIRRHLRSAGIPSTFVGREPLMGDDYPLNILSREKLNELYNAIDLCLVTSRWEGGPYALMEAPAAGCKVLSTRVGLANDILEPAAIFDEPHEAAAVIEKDIRNKDLAKTVDVQYQRVLEGHQVEGVINRFKALYTEIEKIHPLSAEVIGNGKQPLFFPSKPGWCEKIRKKLGLRDARFWGKALTFGIWSDRPQGLFLASLKREFQRRGFGVVENCFDRSVDAYICDSLQFDRKRFLMTRNGPCRKVIHWVDGTEPWHEIIELNKQIAAITVSSCVEIQSRNSGRAVLVNPVVVGNAVDPQWFYSVGEKKLDAGRPVRLVSVAGAGGSGLSQWIAGHLDTSLFSFTVIERYENASHLGKILREHDIYIATDAGSDHLLAALACGLPALFLNVPANRETAGYGGLSFEGQEDFKNRLAVLREHYEMYRNMISVPSIAQVAESYRDCAFLLRAESAMRESI